jgi:hypothetical protein
MCKCLKLSGIDQGSVRIRHHPVLLILSVSLRKSLKSTVHRHNIRAAGNLLGLDVPMRHWIIAFIQVLSQEIVD